MGRPFRVMCEPTFIWGLELRKNRSCELPTLAYRLLYETTPYLLGLSWPREDKKFTGMIT